METINLYSEENSQYGYKVGVYYSTKENRFEISTNFLDNFFAYSLVKECQYSVETARNFAFILNSEIRGKLLSWIKEGDNWIATVNGQPFLNIINNELHSLVIHQKELTDRRFVLPQCVTDLYLPDTEQISWSGVNTLRAIYAPVCKEILDNGLRNVNALKTAYIPQCQIIGDKAFKYANSIKNFNAPECTYLGRDVLYDANSLETFYVPKCITICECVCNNAPNLKDVNAQQCNTIGNFAFHNVPKLTTQNISNCKIIGNMAYCTANSLKECYIPECESIGFKSFHDVPDMIKLWAPKCKTIGEMSFHNVRLLQECFLNECIYSHLTSFTNVSDAMKTVCLEEMVQSYNRCPSDVHPITNFFGKGNVRFVDKNGNDMHLAARPNIRPEAFDSIMQDMVKQY